jgi:hypothetical protein
MPCSPGGFDKYIPEISPALIIAAYSWLYSTSYVNHTQFLRKQFLCTWAVIIVACTAPRALPSGQVQQSIVHGFGSDPPEVIIARTSIYS